MTTTQSERRVIFRANRKTLADALTYARHARETGDEKTAAQFDAMAELMRWKLAQPKT